MCRNVCFNKTMHGQLRNLPNTIWMELKLCEKKNLKKSVIQRRGRTTIIWTTIVLAKPVEVVARLSLQNSEAIHYKQWPYHWGSPHWPNYHLHCCLYLNTAMEIIRYLIHTCKFIHIEFVCVFFLFLVYV